MLFHSRKSFFFIILREFVPHFLVQGRTLYGFAESRKDIES